jgi:hypothetical protein
MVLFYQREAYLSSKNNAELSSEGRNSEAILFRFAKNRKQISARDSV